VTKQIRTAEDAEDAEEKKNGIILCVLGVLCGFGFP
jgi:hypothetical protein